MILSEISSKYNSQWFTVPGGEKEIIWLQDISTFSFVRTRIFWSMKRTSKPHYSGDGLLLGYSISDQESWPNVQGFFERRYFYLQALDLKPNCVYKRTGEMPCEGVEPLTIAPGIWGIHKDCGKDCSIEPFCNVIEVGDNVAP